MPTTASLSASELADRTPASRDRYVDFLRLASIGVVVLGHWLMAVVTWHGERFRIGNVIGMTPGLWLATWALQVMPIFFFVGGFANAVTLDALARRGHAAAEFIASRVDRLLRPVAVLLAVWLPSIVVLEWLGFDRGVLRSATKLVCQPLWFIGVYLGVTALAPLMYAQHRARGGRVMFALVGLVVGVDGLRFGAGVDAFGWLNVLFVWLLAQQLGFFYADGSLTRVRPSRLVAIAGAALAALVLLTTWGPYPRSMVGLPGERISNMSPPTLCLAVLTGFQVAVVMLCRTTALRWLARRSVWTVVVAGNGIIMTIFLWHLTAALIAVAALHQFGVMQSAGATAGWWVTRPLWIACALVPLAGLIAGFGRYERPRRVRYAATSEWATVGAAISAVLFSFAVLGVASSNLVDLAANAPIHVAVITVTPFVLLAAAVGGIMAMRQTTTALPAENVPVA